MERTVQSTRTGWRGRLSARPCERTAATLLLLLLVIGTAQVTTGGAWPARALSPAAARVAGTHVADVARAHAEELAGAREGLERSPVEVRRWRSAARAELPPIRAPDLA